MIIAITGSGGLVGTALRKRLNRSGHRIIRLVRDRKEADIHDDAIFWDPYEKIIDIADLEGIDGLVHLSGESLAERWSEEKKKEIRRSRIESTRFISETLMKLNQKPKAAVIASAIGIYGNRGDEILTEESSPGEGFLAGVTADWEKASEVLDTSGIRTVQLRISMVLAREGGALKKMLPAFKTGVGGKIGNGKQFVSWIAIEDLVSLIEFALDTPELSGPVNASSPNPVTNEAFTRALGETLGRPTVAKIPAFSIKMMFGEMGVETVLASTRAVPRKLERISFNFKYPEITDALTAVIQV